MDYVKQTWNNGPTGGTPLSAERLSVIEDGIDAAHARLDAALVVVTHGANASTARPDVIAVYWVGTVTPTNMTDADIYNGPAA